MLQSHDYMTLANVFSPLVLIDRLITLAEQADHAGMASVARTLIALMYRIGEETPS